MSAANPSPAYDSWTMTCARPPSSNPLSPRPIPRVHLPSISQPVPTSTLAVEEPHSSSETVQCSLSSKSKPEAKVPTPEELERHARAQAYWDGDPKDWHDEGFFDADGESDGETGRLLAKLQALALISSPSTSPTGKAINPKAAAFVPSATPSPSGKAINPEAPAFVPAINPLAAPFIPSQPALTNLPSHPPFDSSNPGYSPPAHTPPQNGDRARPTPLRAYIENPPFSFHDDPRMDSTGRPRKARMPTLKRRRKLIEKWRRAVEVAETEAAEAAGRGANAPELVTAETAGPSAELGNIHIREGPFSLPPPEQMVWRFNQPAPLEVVLREADPREVAQRPLLTHRDMMAYLERRAYVAQQEGPDRWFNAARGGVMREWIQEVRVERERVEKERMERERMEKDGEGEED